MKFLKPHFVFTRSQQNGVFLLVCIIIILQLAYHFIDFSSEEKESDLNTSKIEELQKHIDSLKQLKDREKIVETYPFNPNYISDFKGYQLGMSVEEIDRLHRYREAGKWINSAIDFQKVTGISDSILAKISPYFRFPDWVIAAEKTKEVSKAAIPKKVLNLNTASVRDFEEISGVGEVLANRIVNYRTKIGKFRSNLQLKDIYGLNFETREKLKRTFKVSKNDKFVLLNINSAKVLELVEVPYINYELAREIIDYRQIHEKIISFEELSKIESFPSDKIDRIELYLKID